jgi:hypothetical protein
MWARPSGKGGNWESNDYNAAIITTVINNDPNDTALLQDRRYNFSIVSHATEFRQVDSLPFGRVSYGAESVEDLPSSQVQFGVCYGDRNRGSDKGSLGMRDPVHMG